MHNVRLISNQVCHGNLERRKHQPSRWVNADGHGFRVSVFDDGELLSKLIVSAVLVTDAAIMRVMR